MIEIIMMTKMIFEMMIEMLMIDMKIIEIIR